MSTSAGAASHILGRDLLKGFHRGDFLVDPRVLPEHGASWDPFEVSRGFALKGARREQQEQAAARRRVGV